MRPKTGVRRSTVVKEDVIMSATRIDRDTFLANLRRSKLLSPEQYAEATSSLPQTDRGLNIARALVKRKLLTKFQAEMLLGGRTGGFNIGQYRILDQLGRGGMGRVFKAVHQTMNRIVALKVVASSLVKNERAQQMFMREVRAAARLMHPNIVTAYDANQIGERHYMVMEFVDGPNLEHLVRDRGPLSVGQACDFIRQAALGLQYAHEMGMVHRDIKPANLLVQGVGTDGKPTRCVVKILDFGLARLHEPKPGQPQPAGGSIFTQQNMVVGTPDYISPEQAKDLHKADIRSDLYSLGCTLYYLLTGQVPFPGGNTVEKLVRHGTEEPQPIEQLRTDIPAEVAAIVKKLMAKDPANRYPTPSDLANALAPHAVAAPPTWTAEEQTELDDTDFRTPSVIDPSGGADSYPDSALVGTLPANQALTPLSELADPPAPKSGSGFMVLLIVGLLLALLLAAGVVAAAIALFMMGKIQF
jgi:serine/threonine-protein kinase